MVAMAIPVTTSCSLDTHAHSLKGRSSLVIALGVLVTKKKYFVRQHALIIPVMKCSRMVIIVSSLKV